MQEEIVAEDGSVQTVSTDSFFQVIATAQDSLLKTVKTHVKTEQDRLRESHKAISLQYLEVWRRDAPDSITAFYAEEPRWVDMLDVGRFASLILHLKSWSCGPSHTDGCVELTLPKLVYTRYSVDDLDRPVALKLLQLWRNGWIGIKKKIIHKNVGYKYMDSRNLTSKSLYVSTLLSLVDRLKVNNQISSNQPHTYFSLVLKDVKVEAGLGDKTYRRILDGGEVGDDAALAIGDAEHGGVLCDAESGSCDFDAPGTSTVPRPKRRRTGDKRALPLDDAAPASRSSSESEAGSTDEGASRSSFDGAGPRGEVTKWLNMENGPRFKVDRYRPKRKKEYVRVCIECTYHDGCVKKRSVSTKHVSKYGDREIIAYLMAWNTHGGDVTQAEHCSRGFLVPQADVDRFAARVGNRADHIINLFH